MSSFRFQEIYYPCQDKKNQKPINVLFLFDVLSKIRYEAVAKEISKKFNFYALNVFFDEEYHPIINKPSIDKWCDLIATYINEKNIDLENTVIVAQYYCAAIIPFLNEKQGINRKIKKVVYVSPFVLFSWKGRRQVSSILYKDANCTNLLYNNIDQLKNDVNWIQTSRLENVVTNANISDIKKILRYFHHFYIKKRIKIAQKKYSKNYDLCLFLSDKDEIVDFKKTKKFFSFHKNLKVYPFFNSKLCTFEEEEFKFCYCLINFVEGK
nr:hypothetical protein PlMoll_1370 [uncultured Mycoplasmataceae bacterium]